MKNIVIIITLIVGTFFAQDTLAQKAKKTAELKVKTSAVCEMCETTMQKALVFEKGVKKCSLDVESKILTVVYRPSKTTPEKIREAISKSGYDADDVPADKEAYENLHSCCKKDWTH